MAITCNSIADVIEHFIRIEFQVPADDPLFTRDVNLYDLGFVDSTGLVVLISFVESMFNIKLEEKHLFSDDFTTINGISRVVYPYLMQAPTDADAMDRLNTQVRGLIANGRRN